MNAVRIFRVATVAALLGAPLAGAWAQGPFPTVTWSPGEVFLANGETKTIMHAKTDRDVRICIARSTHNTALRLTSDAQQSETVHPGDCIDIEGRVLTATPAAPLKTGEVVVLRYAVER